MGTTLSVACMQESATKPYFWYRASAVRSVSGDMHPDETSTGESSTEVLDLSRHPMFSREGDELRMCSGDTNLACSSGGSDVNRLPLGADLTCFFFLVPPVIAPADSA